MATLASSVGKSRTPTGHELPPDFPSRGHPPATNFRLTSRGMPSQWRRWHPERCQNRRKPDGRSEKRVSRFEPSTFSLGQVGDGDLNESPPRREVEAGW